MGELLIRQENRVEVLMKITLKKKDIKFCS